jgi:K+-sensing histidine kinase KdpD
MDYMILDTQNEPIFDLITQFAASICEVPLALITFIDRDRQWYKSKSSAAKQVIQATEIPRDVAFCSYTILDNYLFEVTDAIEDERFKNNPFVLGKPHIRFYAGMPLTTQNGCNLGALCVIGDKPKALNERQKEELAYLAQLTMKLLEKRQFELQEEEKNWKNEAFHQAKELLITNLSHELLTPLNAIMGYSQVLAMNAESTISDEQKEFVNHIMDRSRYLLQMITNMLEYSDTHLKALQFNYEMIDLQPILEDVLSRFHNSFAIKQITLSTHLDEKMKPQMLDPYWFQKMIECLLLVAVEISPAHNKIEMRFQNKTPGYLDLEIEVNNIKFDASDLKDLLSDHTQANSNLIKRHPGLGINLTLVKKIVSSQQGQIKIMNSNQASCIFQVSLYSPS